MSPIFRTISDEFSRNGIYTTACKLLHFYSYLWILFQPITVAMRSKARIVFPRSNIGAVGSNLSLNIDVYLRLFYVCTLRCVERGLATRWSPFQGVPPNVYRIKKMKNRPRLRKELYSHWWKNEWMNKHNFKPSSHPGKTLLYPLDNEMSGPYCCSGHIRERFILVSTGRQAEIIHPLSS